MNKFIQFVNTELKDPVLVSHLRDLQNAIEQRNQSEFNNAMKNLIPYLENLPMATRNKIEKFVSKLKY